MAKFSIVTVCKNAARYIEETLESVLSQPVFRSGRCELEYLVFDGASTDATLDVLARYERRGVTVVSEPDAGMYAALAKGLQRATGDYVGYLNAGDFYHPAGLGIAADCFDLPGVNWLTGFAVVYNDRSEVTDSFLPLRYRGRLFECGAYGALVPFHLQQESTIWRRSLHASVDFRRLERLRLAGDAYLWKCFAAMSELSIVAGHIGGFRVHRGQLSEQSGDYVRELRSFSRTPTVVDRALAFCDRLLWGMPESVKARLGRSSLIVYDHARGAWRRP